MSKKILFVCALSVSSYVSANTITDVGVGNTPSFQPSHYDPTSNLAPWSLSSSCIDINNKGQAACQAKASGPTYRCGWRNAQTCQQTVTQVHRWNGTALELISHPASSSDVPLVMNEKGQIAGYAYQGAVYPNGGGNGRIWYSPTYRKKKNNIVTFLNDRGDYIEQLLEVPGGTRVYTSKVFDRHGVEMTFPGSLTLPFVINKSREVVGGQLIQTYANAFQSGTGNERAEVSGVGWMLDQPAIDALPLTVNGEFDVDGRSYWALNFFRDTPTANYKTWVNDINDNGDFIGQTNFGGLYSGAYCTREGETDYRDIFGNQRVLPWFCAGTNYIGGTYAGGKAFKGINNVGDAVGVFTPGVYSYTSQPTTHPWVWLVNATGGWDEFNANELLPANSGYTVLSVNDINDNRDIVGTCQTPNGDQHGCILHLTDQPIPADTVKPFVRIDTDVSTPLSGVVKLDASAWDRRSKIQRVLFKLDNNRIANDRTRPYSAQLDTTKLANGRYQLRVRAYDKAGNTAVKRVWITVNNQVTPPPNPNPGTKTEGQGTISASGADFIDVDGFTVHYNSNTVIKLNGVPAIAVGLPVQYKGTQDANGVVTASYIEVN